MARDPIATLPNIISLSRLAMAVAFPFVGSTLRLSLVMAAAITDFFDGYLARRRGSVSPLGAKLDPASDRGFMLVAVAVLWYDGALTSVAALVLVSRDVIVLAAWALTRRSTALRSFGFAARVAGKVVTVAQLGTIASALVAPDWLTTGVIVVAIATVVAVVDYTIVLMRAAAARRLGVALLASGLAGVPCAAQAFRITPSVQPEVIAGAVATGEPAVLAGVGLNVPAGYYVRVASTVSAGRGASAGDGTVVRAEVVGRFLTDPFRQRRRGAYFGAGLASQWRGRDRGRSAVVLVAGLDLSDGPGWRPALELGVGGGLRMSVVLRRTRIGGR